MTVDRASKRRANRLTVGWAMKKILAGLVLLWPWAALAQEVQFYHLDAIGNVRAVTDASGNAIERHDYLPFGEECTTGPCASNPGITGGQPKHFTGKERDSETGLDYFGARYYRSNLGRFTSVDPAMNTGLGLLDPQRWNRYAYGRGNPLRYVDPDGKVVTDVRLVTSGPNAVGTPSQEAGRVTSLGPVTKGGNFVYAVNVEVDVSSDDSPTNYEPVQRAYILYPKGKNTDPSRPGESDTIMSDNPESKNVVRTDDKLTWADNPGLSTSGVPPASVSGTYVASFQSTVKPKKGTAGKPTDKVLNWAVRVDVKNGEIVNAVATQVPSFPLKENQH